MRAGERCGRAQFIAAIERADPLAKLGVALDGGLLDLLHAELQRLDALKSRQQLSPRDQGRRKLLQRFLRGFQEEEAWLLESESMEVTDAHLVFGERARELFEATVGRWHKRPRFGDG